MRITKDIPGSFDLLTKFGRSPAVAAAEDIWDGGIAYPFPAAAAATTLVSSSADDDLAGTGAQKVYVEGCDANYAKISEIVDTDGVTPVNLASNYLRVWRAYVTQVGGDASKSNLGDISIKVGGVTVAMILTAKGQTMMSIYTIPTDYKCGLLDGWSCSMGGNLAATAGVELQIREFGGGWRTQDAMEVTGNGVSTLQINYPFYRRYSTQTDFRVRVVSISSGTPVMSANFYMALPKL
jgi:hypothetical protein